MNFWENKKLLVGFVAFLVISSGCALFLFWGISFGIRDIQITRIKIPVAQWAGTETRARLLAVADLHFSPQDGEIADELVAMIKKENPDAILFLGDYVEGHRIKTTMPPEEIARRLAPLPATGTPCFAVLGNHDAYIGNDRIKRALDKVGIYTFRDAETRLCKLRNGAEILFGGTIDAHGHFMILSSDIVPKNPLPQKHPFVLLSHSADIVPYLNDSVDLTLCGHSHGGQVCLPGGIPIVCAMRTVARKFIYGLNNVPAGGKVFTSRGIGTSHLPIRLFCPPEILIIELVPA